MSEADIQKACQSLLEILSNQGKLLFQRNNSFAGRVQRSNGSVGYVKNNKKGAPDCYVFMKNGITLHLEYKAPKGHQKQEQKVWEGRCTTLGHKYYIVRSLDELQQILALYLI